MRWHTSSGWIFSLRQSPTVLWCRIGSIHSCGSPLWRCAPSVSGPVMIAFWLRERNPRNTRTSYWRSHHRYGSRLLGLRWRWLGARNWKEDLWQFSILHYIVGRYLPRSGLVSSRSLCASCFHWQPFRQHNNPSLLQLFGPRLRLLAPPQVRTSMLLLR